MIAFYDDMRCEVEYDGYNPITDQHELTVFVPEYLSADDEMDLATQITDLFVSNVLKPALRDMFSKFGLPAGIVLTQDYDLLVGFELIGNKNVQPYQN